MKNEFEILAEILFELDPANTCCVENEAFDEYYFFVQTLLEQIDMCDTDTNKKYFFELFDMYFERNIKEETVLEIFRLFREKI